MTYEERMTEYTDILSEQGWLPYPEYGCWFNWIGGKLWWSPMNADGTKDDFLDSVEVWSPRMLEIAEEVKQSFDKVK